ncbi:hypothetical protein E4J89_00780 [Arthrobacter sp. CAU 1506]|uniref:hypothetical protein n=1 Tax=Arthrobacter sp. CAU 1506 TaxID=2560052 RepID=UPI0010ABD564|nr:hypothetical protein [Arthrobacter sp. CAU 1506]TJY72267.1 hypothetical protein E4J89_00780 [Arthrobacter sp. CAU 1506]
MYLNHFPQPELQVPIFDSSGVRIGVVDYFWRANRLVGEFDGSVKYGRNECLQGQLAADVLIKEKQREDKIRATGVGMARWMWSALFPAGGNQPGLTQQLLQAGLRQDHRNVWDGM